MKPTLVTTCGRVLVIGAIGLLFFAYANFLPTALASDRLADYVKNHFVREVIFGAGLAAWTIHVALQPVHAASCARLSVLGSLVVLPFWIASSMGWSVGGIADVWGDSVRPGAAYLLHGSQVLAFYLGLGLLWAGRDRSGQ